MPATETRPAKPADLEIRPGTLGLPALDKLPVPSRAELLQLLADYVNWEFNDDDAEDIVTRAERILRADPEREPWCVVEECAIAVREGQSGEGRLDAWLDETGRI